MSTFIFKNEAQSTDDPERLSEVDGVANVMEDLETRKDKLRQLFEASPAPLSWSSGYAKQRGAPKSVENDIDRFVSR
ncbi:MAG: hypothetical protein AAFQ65_08655 [Myxococcota bacterium]